MLSTEVEKSINAVRAKEVWPSSDLMKFCKEAIGLAKKYPRERSEIAYWIIEMGRYFGDFDAQDIDPTRQKIKDLAADLELPDAHVDTSDGFSVDQKWQQLSKLVEKAGLGKPGGS